VLIEPDAAALETALLSSRLPSGDDSAWQRIYRDLHPKQRRALDDLDNRKCIPKGRRGGGSYWVAAWLLEDFQLWPGQTSLFLALSKEHAKAILWSTLEEFNSKYSLGAGSDGKEYSWTYPNGYRILFSGSKDKAQVERLRGVSPHGLRRCAIDESGSFGAYDLQFRYMISSVIVPQFTDTHHLGGGQLALIGSPGVDPAGLYYERCTGRTHDGKEALQWSTHRWTALDNPAIDAAGYLLEELVNGEHILDDTPASTIVEWLVALKDVELDDERWAPILARLSAEFRREYLADWCKDSDSLVYLPTEGNYLDDGYELDEGTPWRVVVSGDIGWGDGNGFAVAAKSLRSRTIVLLEAYYLPELNDEEIANELKRLKAAYRAGEVYIDCAGEGQRLLANMAHFGLHCEAQGKGKKKPRIEYLRTVIANRSLQIRRDKCAAVLTEWSALPWSADRQNHREWFVDDVSDAVLGAVNPLSQRFQPGKGLPPKKGEPGYAAHQAKLERASANRRGRRMARSRT